MNNVKLTVEKLDSRHKGCKYFSHRIRLIGASAERIPKFLEIREWCWANWNPSCERETYLSLKIQKAFNSSITLPEHWAWHIDRDHYDHYIYLQTPEDLTMFQLKWM